VLLSQATVSGILNRLERQALIRRDRSDRDKRRVLVWLTRQGIDLVAHGPPPLKEGFSTEFSKLEDWEQTQLLSSLQRVGSMMEASPATPVLPDSRMGAAQEGANVLTDPNRASPEDRPSAMKRAEEEHEPGRGRRPAATTTEQEGFGVNRPPQNRT
jgi:hypothetical protein